MNSNTTQKRWRFYPNIPAASSAPPSNKPKYPVIPPGSSNPAPPSNGSLYPKLPKGGKGRKSRKQRKNRRRTLRR